MEEISEFTKCLWRKTCDPGMIMLKYRESKEEEGRKEGSQINNFCERIAVLNFIYYVRFLIKIRIINAWNNRFAIFF